MTFVNPSYLWAFAGLAIPIAIHLLSRKEGKVIRVGSLRHVEESNTSQFKSIKLNEYFLLFLRSLMVTMLVLFLAGAQCTNPSGNRDKWLMVEPGIDPKTDSLEIHPLPEGNYWSIAKKLGELPHEIVVLSHSRLNRFNGERIDLPTNVQWISVDLPGKRFAATAWQAGDSIFVRTANSTSLATSYSTSFGLPDSIEVIKPGSIDVSIEQNDKSKLVVAAIDVLRNEFKLPIRVNANGSQHITFADGGPLVERTSATSVVINNRLDQDVALNENLVITLFRIFYPNLNEPEIARREDVRTLPDELAWSTALPDSSAVQSSFAGIEKYLIALFMLSLAIERFIAIRRNQ